VPPLKSRNEKGETKKGTLTIDSLRAAPYVAAMPRIARVAAGGLVQHVLNRGNGRMTLFRKPADYAAFATLLADAGERVPGCRLLAYCLMPNHWHLVLRPAADGDLSAYVGWLTNTHVRRWRQHTHTVGQGHVYQGRFKSFVVQDATYFLTLARYVEGNARRAKLVDRAEDWPWGSLAAPAAPDGRPLVSVWPVPRPRHWLARVNEPLPAERLAAVRTALARGRPLGDESWVATTAARLGLGFTIRPRGRPPKKPPDVAAS
jgi:putative transposase